MSLPGGDALVFKADAIKRILAALQPPEDADQQPEVDGAYGPSSQVASGGFGWNADVRLGGD